MHKVKGSINILEYVLQRENNYEVSCHTNHLARWCIFDETPSVKSAFVLHLGISQIAFMFVLDTPKHPQTCVGGCLYRHTAVQNVEKFYFEAI